MDRRNGARRTVAEQSAIDAAAVPERNVLDSVALSAGKVYWVTRDVYNGERGAVHSFDPATADRTEIASGAIRDMQAGPAGAAWSNRPADVPPEVAALPATELASLGTDGTAFGWIGGASEDTTSIGYWSPQTGVVTVADIGVDPKKFRQQVLVFDSYVILDAAGSTANLGSSATIVDTRSGAVVALTPRNPGQYDGVVASMGGTLALAVWAGAGQSTKEPEYQVGLLRTGALNPLSC